LETSSVLNDLAIVDSNTIREGGPWKIYNNRLFFNITPYGKVTIYFIDNVVSEIYIEGDLGVTFEEAVENIGEPEYIISYPMLGSGFNLGPIHTDNLHWIIRAIRPNEGLEYGYDATDSPRRWRKEIQPETRLHWITYFAPGSFEQLADTGKFSGGLANSRTIWDGMHPWVGYGKIEELYPVSGSK
jgi:hypothetical protein